jgi:hypothetical protein
LVPFTNICFLLYSYFPDLLINKPGTSLPTYEFLVALRNKKWSILTSDEKEAWVKFLFVLMPEVVPTYKELLKKAVKKKRRISLDSFFSRINASDDALLMHIIKHKHGVWLENVDLRKTHAATTATTVETRNDSTDCAAISAKFKRKRGQKQGNKKLASLKDIYNEIVDMSMVWLKKEDFEDFLYLGQRRYMGLEDDPSVLEVYDEAEAAKKTLYQKKTTPRAKLVGFHP